MPGSGVLNILEWRARKLAGQTAERPARSRSPTRWPPPSRQRLEAAARPAPQPGRRTRNCASRWAISKRWRTSATTTRRRSAARPSWRSSTRPRDTAQRDAAVTTPATRSTTGSATPPPTRCSTSSPASTTASAGSTSPRLTAKVEQDIAIARLWAPGTIPDAARQTPPTRPSASNPSALSRRPEVFVPLQAARAGAGQVEPAVARSGPPRRRRRPASSRRGCGASTWPRRESSAE